MARGEVSKEDSWDYNKDYVKEILSENNFDVYQVIFIERSYRSSIEELHEAARRSERKGMVFMLYFIAFSLFLLLLYKFVDNISEPVPIKDVWDFLRSFEKFSFIFTGVFFVGLLFKRGRDFFNDSTFYRNEITNLEQKYSALIASIANRKYDQGTLNYVIKMLIKNERNFILRKGETTVDIKKTEIEDKFLQKLVKVIGEAFRVRK